MAVVAAGVVQDLLDIGVHLACPIASRAPAARDRGALAARLGIGYERSEKV